MGCSIQFFAVSLTFCLVAVLGRSSRRIINGHKAKIEDFPHQVSIISNGRYPHICSGSIIDTTHILTAAHCLIVNDNEYETNPDVLAGASNHFEEINGEIYYVIMIIFHHRFNPARFWEHDIALLKLDRLIIYSLFQKPIALPSTDAHEGDRVKISGWGSPSLSSRMPSDDLHEIEMIVISNEFCAIAFTYPINRKHICASTLSGLHVTHGDSGSSLIYENQIVGIVTAGVSRFPGYPALFIRVYEYKRWIQGVIRRY